MITGKVTGEAAALLRLKSLDLNLRTRLRAEITRGAIYLTRYVKEKKLSGQVLKNRTGTLRRKVSYQLTETASKISASVGVQLSYAAAHEYGLDKVESVRAHLRRVTTRDVYGMNEKRRRAKTGSGITFVRAHTRHMVLPERSFLRSSLQENRGLLIDMLRTAVGEAVKP